MNTPSPQHRQVVRVAPPEPTRDDDLQELDVTVLVAGALVAIMLWVAAYLLSQAHITLG